MSPCACRTPLHIVRPVHDVIVQLRDGLRGFRDRDHFHEGSLCRGALGIVPKSEQSPRLASATLSSRHGCACFALGLRDEVVVDFLVGIHAILSCADQDVLVCTLGAGPLVMKLFKSLAQS